MATEMGLILTVVVAGAIVVALIALISISIKVTRILAIQEEGLRVLGRISVNVKKMSEKGQENDHNQNTES